MSPDVWLIGGNSCFPCGRITSYNEVGTIFNIRLVNYSRPVHYPSRIEIELYLIIFARDSLHTRATMRIRIVYSYIFIIYDCQCPSRLLSSRTIIKSPRQSLRVPPPLPSFPFFSLFLFSFFFILFCSRSLTRYKTQRGIYDYQEYVSRSILQTRHYCTTTASPSSRVKLAASTSNYYHYHYTCVTRIRGDNAM